MHPEVKELIEKKITEVSKHVKDILYPLYGLIIIGLCLAIIPTKYLEDSIWVLLTGVFSSLALMCAFYIYLIKDGLKDVQEKLNWP